MVISLAKQSSNLTVNQSKHKKIFQYRKEGLWFVLLRVFLAYPFDIRPQKVSYLLKIITSSTRTSEKSSNYSLVLIIVKTWGILPLYLDFFHLKQKISCQKGRHVHRQCTWINPTCEAMCEVQVRAELAPTRSVQALPWLHSHLQPVGLTIIFKAFLSCYLLDRLGLFLRGGTTHGLAANQVSHFQKVSFFSICL